MTVYTTIEEARQALNEARLDTIADHGEAATDAAHTDLVRAIAESCTTDVAVELFHQEGVPVTPGHPGMKYDPLGTVDWPVKDTAKAARDELALEDDGECSVDIAIKHGPAKGLTRPVSVGLSSPRLALDVELIDDDDIVPGDRQTQVPTIILQEYGKWMVLLTWQEARQLAVALNRITDAAVQARRGGGS